MKKLLLALVLSASIFSGAVLAAGGNQNLTIYTPIIERCATGTVGGPSGQVIVGYRFVLACLPFGNSNCQQEFCIGDIL